MAQTTPPRIRLSKPSITDEEVRAQERVLRSGWLVAGPEGRAFEEELAAACGKRHACVLSSGTAALHLALHVVSQGTDRQGAPPPRLLVPAFTFPATASVAHFVGLKVCLADVDEHTFCLPGETVGRWLSQGRGPAMIVHQFGYPAPALPPDGAAADWDHLLISDAACAIGAQGALHGRCACLSFHPRKLLTTGEGGAVVTDDQGLCDEVRALRAHGLVAHPGAEVMELPRPGLNYRLPEVGAAVGRVQLRRLPQIIEAHRERAQRYRERLLPHLPMQADHPGRVWQTVAVVLPPGVERALLRERMRAAGIETQIASYGLQHLAAFRGAEVFGDGRLLAAGRLHDRGLALPLYPDMTLQQVDEVCDNLLSLMEGNK